MLPPIDSGEPAPALFWIMGPALVAFGVLVAGRMPGIWKAGPEFERRRFAFRFYSEPMASSLMSILPIGSVFIAVAGVLCVLVMVRQEDTFGLRAAMEAATYVVVPVFFGLLLLFFGVYLFGRPKTIIPPPLRHHRGLIGELAASAFRKMSARGSHRSDASDTRRRWALTGQPDRAAFGPRAEGDAGEWARLSQLALSNPELAWRELVAAAERTDDAGLFWVADVAEDLVSFSPETFVPRIEAEAQRNPRFRRALVSLTPTSGLDEFDERLLALRETIERETGSGPSDIHQR